MVQDESDIAARAGAGRGGGENVTGGSAARAARAGTASSCLYPGELCPVQVPLPFSLALVQIGGTKTQEILTLEKL